MLRCLDVLKGENRGNMATNSAVENKHGLIEWFPTFVSFFSIFILDQLLGPGQFYCWTTVRRMEISIVSQHLHMFAYYSSLKRLCTIATARCWHNCKFKETAEKEQGRKGCWLNWSRYHSKLLRLRCTNVHVKYLQDSAWTGLQYNSKLLEKDRNQRFWCM